MKSELNAQLLYAFPWLQKRELTEETIQALKDADTDNTISAESLELIFKALKEEGGI